MANQCSSNGLINSSWVGYSDLFVSLVRVVRRVLTGSRLVFSGETAAMISLSGITLEVCGCLSWSLSQELVSLTVSSYHRRGECEGMLGVGVSPRPFCSLILIWPDFQILNFSEFNELFFCGSACSPCRIFIHVFICLLKCQKQQQQQRVWFSRQVVPHMLSITWGQSQSWWKTKVGYIPFFSSVSEFSVSHDMFQPVDIARLW